MNSFQTFFSQGFFQFGQSLLSFNILRNEIAVVVFQSHLKTMQRYLLEGNEVFVIELNDYFCFGSFIQRMAAETDGR